MHFLKIKKNQKRCTKRRRYSLSLKSNITVHRTPYTHKTLNPFFQPNKYDSYTFAYYDRKKYCWIGGGCVIYIKITNYNFVYI